MKKILYIIVTVIEVLLLAGAFAVNYFTRKKMGMARYVAYKNFQWEKQYRIDLLIYIAAGVLLILTVLLLMLVITRKRKFSKMVYIMVSTAVILTLWCGWFVLSGSREQQRSYYFTGILYAAAALVQVLKAYTGVIVDRHEK